jgi:hypothetical protein
LVEKERCLKQAGADMITERKLAHKIITEVENWGFDNRGATQFCNGIRCDQCPKYDRKDLMDTGSCCVFVHEAMAKHGAAGRDTESIHRKRIVVAWARQQMIGNKLALI